jgi:hypothetical protein
MGINSMHFSIDVKGDYVDVNEELLVLKKRSLQTNQSQQNQIAVEEALQSMIKCAYKKYYDQ